MQASPRYEGPTIISIAGTPEDQLVPLLRQRRRFEATLMSLSDGDWSTASRCAGWSVHDVVAHMTGVNGFWRASVLSGLEGTPTRILATFDPVATPAAMVAPMRDLAHGEVLDQFVASNEALATVFGELDADGWQTTAETPVGHVPIRLLAHHALWDCWIHERDISLPLGLVPTTEADEVRSCLRYVSVLATALAISSGQTLAHVLSVEATDPVSLFVLDVAESVALRDDAAPPQAPCLRGDAVALVEGLSIRLPLPASTPTEWRHLHDGFRAVFSTEEPADI
jgi:uncharacterized protein (TIGR03083 family)